MDMARTTFSGPVRSNNGFESGTSTDPITVSTAGNVSSSYATASNTTGDVRLNYERLTFTSTGSGETARFLTRVTGANAATGGTVNGAHISLSVNSGGSISGAANALRVTLGAAAGVSTGGTVAALQIDSDITNTSTLPGTAAFIRVTNSGSGTLGTLMNIPAAMLQDTTATATKGIKIVDAAGNDFFILCAASL
jgi:hypothetical protein